MAVDRFVPTESADFAKLAVSGRLIDVQPVGQKGKWVRLILQGRGARNVVVMTAAGFPVPETGRIDFLEVVALADRDMAPAGSPSEVKGRLNGSVTLWHYSD